MKEKENGRRKMIQRKRKEKRRGVIEEGNVCRIKEEKEVEEEIVRNICYS